MKKTLVVLTVALAIAMAFALVSCQAEADVTGMASISLAVGESQSKVAMAEQSPINAVITRLSDVRWYATLTQGTGAGRISLNGSQKANGEEFELSSGVNQLELSYGQWTMRVEGKTAGTDVVFTSEAREGDARDITFVVRAASITDSDISTRGAGATVSGNSMTVSVRTVWDGDVVIEKGAVTATGLENLESTYALKWEYSTNYTSWTDWTSSTAFSAGRYYWIRCSAYGKTEATSGICYATGTTDAFTLFKGESAVIKGAIDVSTGSFQLVADKPLMVAFSPNGGTGEVPAAIPGGTATIPTTLTLTRLGYTFGGWNTKADGTGTNYGGGSTFTFTENTVLYAKWNPIMVTSVSLSPASKTLVASSVPVAVKTGWDKTGLDTPVVTYKGRGTTTYAESTDKPNATGTYTATMTVGGKSVTMDFEI